MIDLLELAENVIKGHIGREGPHNDQADQDHDLFLKKGQRTHQL